MPHWLACNRQAAAFNLDPLTPLPWPWHCAGPKHSQHCDTLFVTQAVLLTECTEQLSSGCCPSRVLGHFERSAKHAVTDPLKQEGHALPGLLIQQVCACLSWQLPPAHTPLIRLHATLTHQCFHAVVLRVLFYGTHTTTTFLLLSSSMHCEMNFMKTSQDRGFKTWSKYANTSAYQGMLQCSDTMTEAKARCSSVTPCKIRRH